MLAQRRISAFTAARFSVPIVLRSFAWATIVIGLYAFAGWDFLRIPFQPLSTIGVAVSFYLGFKNNSSYDRFWEGRKIWGAVVNVSRSWANGVMNYVDPADDAPTVQAIRQELVYRHLAWINALRLQLRKKSRFFDNPARMTRRRLERHAEHMRNDWDRELRPFLSVEEMTFVSAQLNPATHLIQKQGERVARLMATERMTVFHQVDMMDMLREMYTLQGKCERIKNTPFPRQYAEYSRIFTKVFVYLIPFGLLDVFAENVTTATSVIGALGYIVPLLASSVLISWVFETMEIIGDASEDPFERSMNDVPMNALCRTIERDLRQMLGEPESSLPPGEAAIEGVLY